MLSKQIKLDNVIFLILILMFAYVIYDIVYSKEYYCGCGAAKKEGFCGNLFSESCKSECPRGFISYAIPGIQTKNQRMNITVQNVDILSEETDPNELLPETNNRMEAANDFGGIPRVENYIKPYGMM